MGKSYDNFLRKCKILSKYYYTLSCVKTILILSNYFSDAFPIFIIIYMIQISNHVGVFRMISSSFNIPILFIHEIRWICNLLPYHPISLHTLLSMILSNTRKNLQKNDFHALCVITIYSFYWLLKYRKDTLFVCYWTKNCNQMVQ